MGMFLIPGTALLGNINYGGNSIFKLVSFQGKKIGRIFVSNISTDVSELKIGKPFSVR